MSVTGTEKSRAAVSARDAATFAGLPTTYQVIHHGREWHFPTRQVATDFVAGWHPTDRPPVVSLPLGGDSRPVLTGAADTVFASKCTSTRWVDDRDEQVRNGERTLAALAGDGSGPGPFQGSGTPNRVHDAQVAATQRIWLAALPGAEVLNGFRVECASEVRAHEGPCGFGPWAWDWRDRTLIVDRED